MADEPTRTPSKRGGRVVSINRASMQRRSTKGPLDIDDPLATSDILSPTSPLSLASPTTHDRSISMASMASLASPATIPLPFSPPPPQSQPQRDIITPPPKDLAFLLRPEIYHPLSDLDIPPPFRSPSHQPPTSTPLPELLQKGCFRRAATLSATVLTSTPPPPNDQVFPLLYTRLACLCLLSHIPLAAQESLALEDLSSAFYRHAITGAHIVPWELRVLAARLQSHGDTGRVVVGFYELAREARVERKRAKGGEESKVWGARVRDLGVRVANALIEGGDLVGAGRCLQGLRVKAVGKTQGEEGKGKEGDEENQLLLARLVLLYIRIGDLHSARRHLDDFQSSPAPPPSSPPPSPAAAAVHAYATLLPPLLSLAHGADPPQPPFLDPSPLHLRCPPSSPPGLHALQTHNAALQALYADSIASTRAALCALVEQGHAFSALLFNLCTVYELTSDRSRALKAELAERVARRWDGMVDKGWEGEEVERRAWGWERGGGVFKLL